jgi:CheY-like chemotaxis protein
MTGTKTRSSTIHILVVEDNEGDIRLIKEGFREAKIDNELSIVKNGEEAVQFLQRREKYKDVRMPDLILLDLNLPKKDGRELLREIKTDEHFKHIPVIILTTSNNEQDILKSYKLHANCYIQKPLNLDQFIDVVSTIDDFWFSVVKLPSDDQ